VIVCRFITYKLGTHKTLKKWHLVLKHLFYLIDQEFSIPVALCSNLPLGLAPLTQLAVSTVAEARSTIRSYFTFR